MIGLDLMRLTALTLWQSTSCQTACQPNKDVASASRRATSPGSTFPPPYTQRRNSAAAAAQSR